MGLRKMKPINSSELWKKRLGDWVVTPYVGCEHGCFHCYCPAMPGVKFFNHGYISVQAVESLMSRHCYNLNFEPLSATSPPTRFPPSPMAAHFFLLLTRTQRPDGPM